MANLFVRIEAEESERLLTVMRLRGVFTKQQMITYLVNEEYLRLTKEDHIK